MNRWDVSKDFTVLERCGSTQTVIPDAFRESAAKAARNFHQGVEGYMPTPLVELPGLAKKLGVRGIYVKNESKRFKLNAFKGLGGSYAMFRILCEKLHLNPETTTLQDLTSEKNRESVQKIEFVTATDGNHGRGVSWAAGIFGCKAHVYMPFGSQEVRAEAIRKVGPAEVQITDMSYDDTVQYAKTQSDKYGWILIQDTAWDGYEKIPSWIIQGYLTMASEAVEQIEALHVKPSHVFLQAGVGAMAGGVLGYLVDHYKTEKPIVTIVEPCVANCIFTSAEAGDGKAHSVEGAPVTIMAGLNCGTPCKITWPVLRDYAEFYVSCPDYVAAEGMRAYAAGLDGDEKVISGESGAATMGAAEQILSRADCEEVRREMKLDQNSILFFISTEGDTDPENYRNVMAGMYPAP